MRSSGAFVIGFAAGALCAVLLHRLREVVEESDDIDDLTERISDHLAELERRATEASEAGGPSSG